MLRRYRTPIEEYRRTAEQIHDSRTQSADQKRKVKDHLENVLLEALKSEPELVTPQWWAKLRKEIRSES
jgi:hypothetical protein